MRCDVVIVGAGPIGCYLGERLASGGLNVVLVEEHKKPGFPWACTGLLSKNLFKFVKPPKKIFLNKIFGAEVFSPDNHRFKIETKEPQAFVIDRPAFDLWLSERAKRKGVKLLLGQRFLDFLDGAVKTSTLKIKTNAVIGADGPLSSVAKKCGLFNGRRFWVGIQIQTELPVDKKLVQVYLSKQFSKDFFAWVVPEGGGICRVGIASSEKPAAFFKKFICFLEEKQGVKINPISKQVGLIPQHKPFLKIEKKNVFLVGDAATHVKATTGGGIIFGFSAANLLARALLTGKRYSLGKVGRELKIHLLIRRLFNCLPERIVNRLVLKLSEDKIVHLLKEKGDMDYISAFWKEVAVVLLTSLFKK